ncbi:hypothetical protein [Lacticigenium naphthae]|uniref:hypothetical protein n=1 Tax=Lacticigenium naphthae TaxID=515351 RepID=UPI00040E5C45|nr:hypothetical protein [Lacticigenium naphthae]
MKRIVILFTSLWFIAGCGSTTPIPESGQAKENTLLSPAPEGIGSFLTYPPFISVDTKKEDPLLFVPQKQERKYLREFSDDPVLVELETEVRAPSFMKGTVPDLVTVHLSSVLFEDRGKTYIALLVANRTEESVTNEFLQISIRSVKDRVIKLHTTHLSPSDFGVLAPQTVMPLYMELSPWERYLFEGEEARMHYVIELFRRETESSDSVDEIEDYEL